MPRDATTHPCPLCDHALRHGLADASRSSASTDDGRRAIVDALGRSYLRDATECYLAHREGAPLAWCVLQILKPQVIRAWILPLIRSRKWSSPRVVEAADLLSLVVRSSDTPLVSSMIASRSPTIRAAGARAATALVEHGRAPLRAVDGWIERLLAAGLGAGALLLDVRIDLPAPIAAARRRKWIRHLRALGDPYADEVAERLTKPAQEGDARAGAGHYLSARRSG